MPKKNDISDDELIMDEEIQPKKNHFTENSQIFSSTNKSDKKRKPVLPFFLGFLASLALFIGLCFVSGWFAWGLLVSAALFTFTIKNNDYNNLQKANEWQQQKNMDRLNVNTPTNDLVVENIINKGKNLNLNKNNAYKQEEETDQTQASSSIGASEEQSFTSNFNENTANKKNQKFNSQTKTNLDLINNSKEQNDVKK